MLTILIVGLLAGAALWIVVSMVFKYWFGIVCAWLGYVVVRGHVRRWPS